MDYKSLLAKFGNDTGNAINLCIESLELGREELFVDGLWLWAAREHFVWFLGKRDGSAASHAHR